jgi:hypothetical protein
MKDFREFLLRGNLVDVCLSEVPVLARRCAFCTAGIGLATA